MFYYRFTVQLTWNLTLNLVEFDSKNCKIFHKLFIVMWIFTKIQEHFIFSLCDLCHLYVFNTGWFCDMSVVNDSWKKFYFSRNLNIFTCGHFISAKVLSGSLSTFWLALFRLCVYDKTKKNLMLTLNWCYSVTDCEFICILHGFKINKRNKNNIMCVSMKYWTFNVFLSCW